MCPSIRAPQQHHHADQSVVRLHAGAAARNGARVYMIPKVDVQVAGTFRSDQGDELAANWTSPANTVGLNRRVRGGARRSRST